MNAETVTLIAAIVAAASGLATVLLSTRRTSVHERNVWRRGEVLRASVHLLSEANELRRMATDIIQGSRELEGDVESRLEQHDAAFHHNFLVLLLTGDEPIREAAQELSRAQARFRLHLYDRDNSFPDTDHYGDMVGAEERFIDACRNTVAKLGGFEPLRL